MKWFAKKCLKRWTFDPDFLRGFIEGWSSLPLIVSYVQVVLFCIKKIVPRLKRDTRRVLHLALLVIQNMLDIIQLLIPMLRCNSDCIFILNSSACVV
jgi:hypothetical protein